jgi:secreted protein with Ig-like and vWFA domain
VAQATREMRATDKIGIVKFGQNAQIAAPPLTRGKIVADLSVSDGGQTNIARAITTALSAFPPDVSRRIVLVSDGNENAGEAIEAARSAASDSVPIDVVPIGNPLTQEVTLDRMMTPPAAKRGEPFPVTVVATSVGNGPGTLRLLRNGKYVGEQKVDLKPAKTFSC